MTIRHFEIHNDFNELDFSADAGSKNDLFDKLTKDIFEDTLLFAIIETTTISNASGVGTTQYIAYKSNKYIQETIHKEYFDIIRAMEETECGSLSQYYDWYRRSDFYYAIGTNEAIPASNEVKILNSKILDPDKKLNAEEYITDYEKKLSDEEIRFFFQQYTRCLLQKEWFRELPHYFILVKPISVIDETGLYTPLGNLYLKIGTSKKIELKEYKKYVSMLQAAWFNKFGAKVLKEYSSKKISDEYKPRPGGSLTIANKLVRPLFKNNGSNITLNDFFYYTFDTNRYSNLRNSHLYQSNHPLIRDLIIYKGNKNKIKNIIKDTYDDKNDPLNVLNKTYSGLKKVDEDSIKYFLLLLSKRRLALALLLIFDFTLEETHEAMAFGERIRKKDSKPKDHTDFLLNNLFITQSNAIEQNTDLLAKKEIQFLIEIANEIKKTTPTFHCKLFQSETFKKS